MFLYTSQVDPVYVFTSSITFVPIWLTFTFFRSSNSKAAFFGSLGLGAGGTLPPFFLISSICL